MRRHRIQRGRKSAQKGFTLVEMLVAVGVFSIIMTMMVSALLTMIFTNRQAHALNLVTTNLHFAVESISRHIHDANEIACLDGSTQECPTGELSIFITSQRDINKDTIPGDTVEYRIQNGALERRINGVAWQRLTGPDIQIDAGVSSGGVSGFFLSGTIPSDDIQPRLTLVLRATANVVGEITTFNIQTTVTPRYIDI